MDGQYASAESYRRQVDAALENAVEEWDRLVGQVQPEDLDALRELHDVATSWLCPSFIVTDEVEHRQRLLCTQLYAVAMLAMVAEQSRRHAYRLATEPAARPSFMRRALCWPLRLIGMTG